MAREKLTIPFGGGLDRYSGPVVVDQGRSRDVRNVILTRGRARARDGYSDVSTLVTSDAQAVDTVLDIRELEAEYAVLLVGYVAASREVWIFRADSDASNPEPLGRWFTAPTAEVPRVVSCEVNELIFFAHDERSSTRRAATYRYDGASATTLAPLTVDWTGTTEEVAFRGVAEHLGLLIGWGWGTPTDPDRPEILRHSRPEGPTILEANDYGLFGARGAPIIACTTGVGSGLLVAKRKETHALLGYGSRTFRPELVDARFGVMGARLGVEVGGAWYVWTAEGPAVTSGGALELLSLPLDLGAPEPVDLVAAGAVEDGFALYVPGLRLVQWIFGRRVYSLSILEPGKWEWSYHELADEIRCAAPLAGLTATVPVGYPDAEPATAIEPGRVTANWLNVDAVGDEFCEVWLSDDAGLTWFRHSSVRVTGAAQALELAGLSSGTDYEAAMRYRRGSLYTAGYENEADPSLWPAVSLFSFTTAIAGDAAISSSWQRTSATDEEITLSFDDVDPTATIEVYYREAGTADPFVLLTASPLPAGTASYTDAWIDTDNRGETLWEYKVVETIGANTRETLLEQWAGPPAPTGLVHRVVHPSLDADWYAYTLDWTAGDLLAETDVRDDYYCNGTFQHRTLEAAGDESATVNTLEKNSTDLDSGQLGEWPFSARVWHSLTTFGVVDWSRYAEVAVNARIADDETAGGSCGGSPTGGGGGSPPDVPVEAA